MKTRIVLMLIAGSALAAEDINNLAEYKQAKEIARQVLERSRKLLMEEMEKKGPAGAVQACSSVAMDLARKHEKEGWRIRRVSDRLRNPQDAPDAYEARILGRFASMKANGTLKPASESVEVVIQGGKRYLRYIKPIFIPGPLCLKCHGLPAEIAPDVRARLRQLYPDDQATGYRIADLRGAVSVKIPME